MYNIINLNTFVVLRSTYNREVIFLRYQVCSTYTYFVSEIATYKFAFNLLTFFILFNNLIPISLQVTVEVVRFMQVSVNVVFIYFIIYVIFYNFIFYLGNVHQQWYWNVSCRKQHTSYGANVKFKWRIRNGNWCWAVSLE